MWDSSLPGPGIFLQRYWGPRTVHHYERGSATLSMLCATHHYQCQCAWFSMLKCTVWAIRDGFRARSPRSGTRLGPEKPGRSFCAGSAVPQLTSVEDYTTYNFVITTIIVQSRQSHTRSCTMRAVQLQCMDEWRYVVFNFPVDLLSCENHT